MIPAINKQQIQISLIIIIRFNLRFRQWTANSQKLIEPDVTDLPD